jgi:hypothetical protein
VQSLKVLNDKTYRAALLAMNKLDKRGHLKTESNFPSITSQGEFDRIILPKTFSRGECLTIENNPDPMKYFIKNKNYINPASIEFAKHFPREYTELNNPNPKTAFTIVIDKIHLLGTSGP